MIFLEIGSMVWWFLSEKDLKENKGKLCDVIVSDSQWIVGCKKYVVCTGKKEKLCQEFGSLNLRQQLTMDQILPSLSWWTLKH